MNTCNIANFALKALPLAIAAALPSQVFATQVSNEDRITDLEQQIQALQEQQSANLLERFKFNGFMSMTYFTADNDSGFLGSSTSANFSDESKLGFQGSFSIAKNTQAVMQLMMKGKDDWNVEAEWAYVSHKFDNAIEVRAGKLRLPLFMYSDYLDVGYAQPFARPPEEVYGAVPFTSYTGGDLSYSFEFDDSSLTVQAFGGEAKDRGADFDNVIGANLTWTDEVWTLRAVYGQTTVNGTAWSATTVPTQDPTTGLPIEIDAKVVLFELEDDSIDFTGIGLSYDDGQLLAVSEWTRIEVEGPYTDSDAGYLTLGYRIGDFTPYTTAAYYQSKDDNDRPVVDQTSGIIAAIFNAKRTTYSGGVRWDVLDNTALKFDITYTHDFDNTAGGFTSNVAQNYDSATVYTVKFDVVF
ncbi:hypothetical protein N9W21_05835 [Shewanella sp.]|nr:hypothetical protein [Shewanella sp.]